MNKHEKHFYDFAGFRIDVGDRVLLDGSRAVALTPKAFDTLLFLIENNGRVVGRDEIMQG